MKKFLLTAVLFSSLSAVANEETSFVSRVKGAASSVVSGIANNKYIIGGTAAAIGVGYVIFKFNKQIKSKLGFE
jgi:hypothetical protein